MGIKKRNRYTKQFKLYVYMVYVASVRGFLLFISLSNYGSKVRAVISLVSNVSDLPWIASQVSLLFVCALAIFRSLALPNQTFLNDGLKQCAANGKPNLLFFPYLLLASTIMRGYVKHLFHLLIFLFIGNCEVIMMIVIR